MEINKIALTFDDIQLLPCSEPCMIRSRKDIDLTTNVTRNYKLKNPIIASPMDTICDSKMAIAMYKLGGLGVIHRFMSIEDQVNHVKELVNHIDPDNIGAVISAAIGVTGDYLERAIELVNAGVNVLFLDTAHGNHVNTKEAMYELKRIFPNYIDIVPGNVAHYDAAYNLMKWGADAIRVGIGNGCFSGDSKVLTENGLVEIKDIKIGDKVLTHTKTYKEVVNKLPFNHFRKFVEINGIKSTPNHEYYVIEKDIFNNGFDPNEFEKIVTENAKWVPAEELNMKDYWLIKYVKQIDSFQAIEIKSIIISDCAETVYDLTVEEDHSYNIEGIIVHNSVCSTRTQTKIGIPSVTSLLDCSNIDLPIIMDGGMRTSGDIAASLALGASSIMTGSLLSGTDECPGEVKYDFSGNCFKTYRGSASYESKIARGEKKNVEGVSTSVPYRGGVERIVNDLMDGLKSSLSYTNSRNLIEFRCKAKWIQITSAGFREAQPHKLAK